MKKLPAGVMLLLFMLLACIFTAAATPSAHSAPASVITPKWELSLPAGSCIDSGTHCHIGSPTIADMDNDGIDDIVVATNNGHILAIKNNGASPSVLWNVNIASAFGAGSHEITSSPAVADIDEDGRPEVVVGTGTIHASRCTQGGLIALEHNGAVKAGWPVVAEDFAVAPPGCADTVYSTPALADMDGDGDLEITAGGFDKRIYGLHHDGSWMSGYPPNSYHYETFGWPILVGRTADTIWGSPAVADMNGDGRADMVLGTDEGNYDTRHDPNSTWTCPYPAPLISGYCGGSINVVDSYGNLSRDVHKFVFEAVQSTPALHDINQDGTPEIIIGGGTFYNLFSSTRPTVGQRFYVLDGKTANEMPGWEGGKVIGGNVPGSPAVGDIAGDSEPEIVVTAMDGKIYAWHLDGTAVSGFPMTPVTQTGIATPNAFNVPTTNILADYDGDGKMEIFLNQSWTVTIVDGNGQQLTNTNFPTDSKPLYIADNRLSNNPAVGDIDGDGELELVVYNSTLTVWDLPSGAVEADWPMFKQNAARTSYDPQPTLYTSSQNIVLVDEAGANADLTFALDISNVGPGNVEWTATATRGSEVTISETAGALSGTQTLTIEVKTRTMGVGANDMGNINLIGMIDGRHVVGSPRSVSVDAYLFTELNQAFLPSVVKE